MELRVLRYFLTIVNEQSISHAANKLHISQPTISRQIHELESELGVSLFERNHRGIKLTSAGEYLANQARQLIALADKTSANINKEHEISGSVFLGCAEIPMMSTIAQTIANLTHSAPKITVNLHSCDAREVHEKMQNGIFDFGVTVEPINKTDYNFLVLPGSTAWGVLTRKDNPLANQTGINVDDLHNQRMIVPQQQSSLEVINQWLGSSFKKLNVVATYNLLYNASLLAQARVGSAICLDGIINTVDTDLVFIPLVPRQTAQVCLIWSKALTLSPAVQKFLTELKLLLPVS
ncbi:LysR family transcriptional regulator [Lactobacillus sp. ESL0684]|uniref:LysR family transcriptional regulator n=1 Tax=Lactobacillus sp. ESL0684 TaxID=2983213 RepID=UPI0023F6D7BA|nr:LysR family transcriptional regulator [Lactobacillus sp. ESL0684]WEV43969.1 LysR family transcriptional regulator [Lactobacillus sp. ESL0684]